MRKIVLFFTIVIALCLSEKSFSWDSDAAKYMPLQVGNTWVYKSEIWTYSWFCYAYERYKIVDTTRINGHLYFNVTKSHTVFYPVCDQQNFPVASRLFQYQNIRIDSNSLNLYSLNSCVIDSLGAREGDSVKVCPNHYVPVICDTLTQALFNQVVPVKSYIFHIPETTEMMQYGKNIGLYRYFVTQPGPSGRNMILQGCVINGVLYGDTNSLVGLNQINAEIPERFELLQNYPNPFNPTTQFGFRIADFGLVNLTIYDALGKEVTALVNEELQPGTYEVSWDASSYPSGMYYYRLDASNPSTSLRVTETKKMVLIK